MKFKKRIVTAICMMLLVTAIPAVPVSAASKFDAEYYAANNPDVVAELGTSYKALYNHYITFGMKEGRIPYEGAQPGEPVKGIQNVPVVIAAAPTGTNEAGTAGTAAAGVVPVNQLANLSSLRKNMTNDQLNQAYNAALEIVTPYIGLSREEQLMGIATSLRYRADTGVAYSMSAPHYNDPYGYLILGNASCAGCARTTGLCLNMLGIPYEHVNANQYSHQWCRVEVNGTYWICDAYGLYCGPEPAPYAHPYF